MNRRAAQAVAHYTALAREAEVAQPLTYEEKEELLRLEAKRDAFVNSVHAQVREAVDQHLTLCTMCADCARAGLVEHAALFTEVLKPFVNKELE